LAEPRGDTPERVAQFWWQHVESASWFRPDKECAVVILLDARHRIIGFELAGLGTLDSIHIHARDVFRAAIIKAAAAVVIAHNHPSGDTSPSEGDIKVTREMMRTGQLLKIDLLDSVVMGRSRSRANRRFTSLRTLGYFGTGYGDAPAHDAAVPVAPAPVPADGEAWKTWNRLEMANREVTALHHALITLLEEGEQPCGEILAGLQSLGWRTQKELGAISESMRPWVNAERRAQGLPALPAEGGAAA